MKVLIFLFLLLYVRCSNQIVYYGDVASFRGNEYNLNLFYVFLYYLSLYYLKYYLPAKVARNGILTGNRDIDH